MKIRYLELLAKGRRPLLAWVTFCVYFWSPAISSIAATDTQASRFYEDALQRFERQDHAGAIVQLKNALQIDRQLLPVHVLLGKALLANGEVAASEAAFNEALQLGVSRAEVVVPLARATAGQARLLEVVAEDSKFNLGGLPPRVRLELLLEKAAAHSDLGSPREALRSIEEAKSIDRQAPEVWRAEVSIHIRARRFKEAAAAAQQAIALAPAEPEGHYLLGSAAHAQGSIGDALAAYERALKLQPKHVEARVARAGLYMDQGKLDLVAAEVSEARKLAPRDPRPTYLAAMVAERRGDHQAARSALSEITGLLDPVPIAFMRFRPQLLMLGGLAHHGLGNNEAARPYFEAVVRQQSDAPAAKLLAQIYLAENNQDRAIETLETYLKSKPADSQAAVLLATAQLGKGRSARAVQVLQSALLREDSPRMNAFLGFTLAAAGKPVDALAALEKAYRRDPKQVAVGAALVDLYVRNGQASKAVELAELLVKRAPTQAQFHALVGHARAAQGETARARSAYEQAVRLGPVSSAVDLGLARLDLRERRDKSAADRLNAILARDPNHVEALMELAWIAERQGQVEAATRLMAAAADHSDTKHLAAAQGLVDLHLRGGRIEAAREAMKGLDTRAPDSLPVLLTGARVRLASKDLQGAQALLTRASRTADFDADTLSKVALLQLSAQDPKGALYTASKALQANPRSISAQALVVDASLRIGDITQAEKTARDLARQDPKSGLPTALMGDIALARGQAAAALDAYRRAFQMEPTSQSLARWFNLQVRVDASSANPLAERWLKSHPADHDIRRLLAANYARTGQLAQARNMYESITSAVPDDAESLNNLANVMVLQGDVKAVQVAERALAIKPSAAHIIGTTGWAAHLAGQDGRALQLLRDARLRDPSNPDTRYFLAVVLAKKGRADEARSELQVVLSAGTASSFSKEARELLKTLK